MGKQLRLWMACASVVAWLAPWTGAEAQIFTPTYLAPRTSSDVGLYVSSAPGDLTLEGIWRRGSGRGSDVGLRIGLAEIRDDLSLLVGAEVRSPLAAGAAPLELAVTGGAQAVVGGREGVGAQVGISLGHTFAPGSFTATPYLHPRVALASGLNGFGELELDLLADLGVDLHFRPNLTVRVGLGFQPGGGLGVGLAWR